MSDLIKNILFAIIGISTFYWFMSDFGGWRKLAEKYRTENGLPQTFLITICFIVTTKKHKFAYRKMKYKSMTKSQLKQYLLNNRDDKEALKELKSRPKQNVITIPANTSPVEQEQILKQAIFNIKSN